jgi:rhodanese-related sulfurtransferase
MNKQPICRWLCFAALAAATSLPAVTPAGVQELLDKGEKVVLIDVRPLAEYKAGHIPNAISVPSQLVPAKELPPIGRVIVYDDGLGTETSTAAAASLNQKNGITAEVLDGGYAAWLDNKGATTQPRGTSTGAATFITYDKLKQMPSGDVVLVDLRQTTKAASLLAATNKPTDLAQEFPGVRVVTSAFDGTKGKQSLVAKSVPPLMVLIDNADGKAQETARALRANGIHRFVILAGGEKILVRHGESGMDRLGTTITSRNVGNTNVILK